MRKEEKQTNQDRAQLKKLAFRISNARIWLLCHHGLLGNLVMNLKLGFAKCETACTDMRIIAFDPDFAARLSDEEIRFVMMHEVMHCVLGHPVRGKGKKHLLYNIACDIVVNSNILYYMERKDFSICGEPVMHLAPNKKEGYLYTAEEVYMMLQKNAKPCKGCCNCQLDETMGDENCPGSGGCLDNHDIWKEIREDAGLEEEWKRNLIAAEKMSTETGPGLPAVRQLLEGIRFSQRRDWRELLREFLQPDGYDYGFLPSDRRFSEGPFIMPSFYEDPESTSDIWFCVDTSGSISLECLSAVMAEIKDAMEQIGNLKGWLSWFDTKITEPVPFDSVKSLEKIVPKGLGGTSFRVIFNDLETFQKDHLPRGIVILTDGYAIYPGEEEALGIPVLWVITNEHKQPPWGKVCHLPPITRK